MLQKLITEMKDTASFLGLELAELVVRQWGENGATGTCRVGGTLAYMPKFRETDNFRKLTVGFLINYL